MRKPTLVVLSLILILILAAFALPGLAQEPSVAEAARKAREKKKGAPKATRVITNDNILPSGGAVSVIGGGAPTAEKAPEGSAGAAPGGAGAAASKEGEKEKVKDEAYWRGRFDEARSKARQAEKELDILQRELNLMQVQYYSDPNQALREQFERKDINEHRQKIIDKQKEIQQLKQALSDLEDELRRSGGPPAWSR